MEQGSKIGPAYGGRGLADEEARHQATDRKSEILEDRDMKNSQLGPELTITSMKRPKSVKTKARKFYRLFWIARQTKVAGIQLLNDAELFAGTAYRTLAPPGILILGFRHYPVRPRFRISTRLGRKLNDIEFFGNYWIVTEHAKKVLAELSGTDFAFLAVEAEVDPGLASQIIWLCDVIPMLDAVDDYRSKVTVLKGDSGERIHEISANTRLVFHEAIVNSHHAFRLTTNFLTIICDDVFKARINEAGVTGLSFQPA